MPVPRHVWLDGLSVAGITRRGDAASIAARWDLPADDALPGAIVARIDTLLADRPELAGVLEDLLTGRPPSAALERELAERGLVAVEEAGTVPAWELVASARLDFAPPLLASLLGRLSPSELDALAGRAGVEPGADLRGRVYRTLRSTGWLRARAEAIGPGAIGLLSALIERFGAPFLPDALQSSRDAGALREAGVLLGYPDAGSAEVTLPLEVGLAAAVLRLDVLTENHRVALDAACREAKPGKIDFPSRALVREAAVRLAADVDDPAAAAGKLAPVPAAIAAGAVELAGSLLPAAREDRLVLDLGEDTIAWYALAAVVSPRDPLRERAAELFRMPTETQAIARMRSLLGPIAGPAGEAAGLVAEIVNRWISRLQFDFLTDLSRLPDGRAVDLDALALLLHRSAVVVAAALHGDLDAMSRYGRPELQWPGAGGLMVDPPTRAARAHVEALVDRLLGPLGLAVRVAPGDRVAVRSRALAPLLQRIRDGALPAAPAATTAIRYELDGDALVAEAPAGVSIVQIARLAAIGEGRPLADGRWRIRLSPSALAAADPARLDAVRAALVATGATESGKAAGWMERFGLRPLAAAREDLLLLSAATEEELDWLLARRGDRLQDVVRISATWCAVPRQLPN